MDVRRSAYPHDQNVVARSLRLGLAALLVRVGIRAVRARDSARLASTRYPDAVERLTGG